MSEGDNLNFLKTQTYVLKVNTHCEGCKHKVKKLLQKIDGVYTITIDSEQEKVTVTGTVDPAVLIKKLSKAGKHSELLLAPKGGGNNKGDNFLREQLQKLQLEAGKSRQKDSGTHQKGQQLPQQVKGSQDLKLPQLKDFKLPPPQKEQKNVKFDVPIDDLDDDEGSEFDDDSSDSEDYDDDDEDDDLDSIVDFEDDPKQSNLTPMKDQKKGSDGNDKKGDGEKDKKANGGKNLDDNAKNSNGEKNSAKNLDNAKNSNGGKKTGGGGGGGGGQPMNLNPKMVMGQGGNQEMDMGRMKASMGHAMSMPPGYYQGGGMAGPTDPYLHHQQQQQQYMAAMQQRMMMMNSGPQIAYGQPMGYGPPAYGEPAYAHYFSDENANSCSIM